MPEPKRMCAYDLSRRCPGEDGKVCGAYMEKEQLRTVTLRWDAITRQYVYLTDGKPGEGEYCRRGSFTLGDIDRTVVDLTGSPHEEKVG